MSHCAARVWRARGSESEVSISDDVEFQPSLTRTGLTKLQAQALGAVSLAVTGVFHKRVACNKAWQGNFALHASDESKKQL